MPSTGGVPKFGHRRVFGPPSHSNPHIGREAASKHQGSEQSMEDAIVRGSFVVEYASTTMTIAAKARRREGVEKRHAAVLVVWMNEGNFVKKMPRKTGCGGA